MGQLIKVLSKHKTLMTLNAAVHPTAVLRETGEHHGLLSFHLVDFRHSRYLPRRVMTGDLRTFICLNIFAEWCIISSNTFL